jgi:hypothetical protein
MHVSKHENKTYLSVFEVDIKDVTMETFTEVVEFVTDGDV